MLPLFCVTTGVSHPVQLAILVNFLNAVLNAKRFYNHLKFLVPGRVAQSVGHLTRKSEVLGSIPGLATFFRFSFH